MATPTGITLRPTDVIIELAQDDSINTFITPLVMGGYVRQIGISVVDVSIDDYVQYDAKEAYQFIQDNSTFIYVSDKAILFIQDLTIV